MNNWYQTDNLQPERMGVSRNAFFGSIFFALALWQFAEFALRSWDPTASANPVLGSLPLAGSALLWWFVLLPKIRRWNDMNPRGTFEGLLDFYFSNPQTLQVGNDPDPHPLYVGKSREEL